MGNPKKSPSRIINIFSTDFKIQEMIEKGFWVRQRYLLQKYSQKFKVDVYSPDTKSYTNEMPHGVFHIVSILRSKIYGLRHILFYLFLIKESFKWKKEENAVIRVYGVANPILPIIKAISRKKIVTSFQYNWGIQTASNYSGIKSMVSRPIQYIALKTSDYVICTTNWLHSLAIKKYSKRNIAIIPNFVDLSLFRPLEKKKRQIDYVGRLHWSKGVDVLIRAFFQFNKIHPDYSLMIIGDGEERMRLQKLSMANEKISFYGNLSHSNVARYLGESEIFVLPTKTMEGHPKALVEAMASGCKCITSNVRGNKEVMKESETSDLMFRKGDPQDLFEKLLFARHYSSKTQYQYAINNYDADVLIEKEIVILQNNLS